MDATSRTWGAGSELWRALFVAGCVGVVAFAWVFPTDRMSEGVGLQSLFGGLGVLTLMGLTWLFPSAVRPTRLSYPELALAAFVIIGSLVTAGSPAALGRLAQPIWWIEAFLVVVVLARIADRRVLIAFLHGYGLLAVIASVVFVAAYLSDMSARMPFLIYRNHFAFLLILPAAFYFHRLLDTGEHARPLRDGAALLILVPTLLLTQSRAVWLGLMVAATVIVISVVRRRLASGTWRDLGTLLLVPVVILVVAIAADRLSVHLGHGSVFAVVDTFGHPDEGSIGGRLRRWMNTLALIRDHWFIGVGLGNWPVAYASYRHTVVPDSGGDLSAASTYLLLLAETGIVGTVLFLTFVLGALRRGFRSNLPAAVPAAALGWLVALAFHSLYDFKVMLLGFAVVFGLLLWSAGAGTDTVAPGGTARRWWSVALVIAVSVFVMDARYSVAEMERQAVYGAIWHDGGPGDDRLMWRLLDPLSPAIDPPITRRSVFANAGGLVSANRFQRPDHRDFFVLLGNHEQSRGATDAARSWYERALARNPDNLAALAGACSLAVDQDDGEQARDYCGRGLRTNNAAPVFHRLLASLDTRSAHVPSAIAHLEKARGLFRARLGFNNFGNRSRHVVDGQYATYRTVNDDLARLYAQVPAPRERVLQEVVETPLLHKSIAVMGCELYFSSNINARFNLWKYSLCGAGEDPQLVTNDSRSPFRLHAAGEKLYFMADDRGDDRFSLYALDTVGDTVRRIDLPRGILLEYSPSPDARQLAVVIHDGRAFRLYAGDPENGRYQLVHSSKRPLSEPVWYPSTPGGDPTQFLVTDGNRHLIRGDLRNMTTTELIQVGDGEALGPVAISDDGSRIAYVTRSGLERSALRLRNPNGRTLELASSDQSVFTSPLWRSADTVVFREVVGDEYLLRQTTIGGGQASAIGPPAGVVYGVERQPGSGSLVFVAATEDIPASIFRIPDNAIREELLLRLDWIPPSTVIPYHRLMLDEDKDVVAYRYPAKDPVGTAIVWLHGGSNRFSPRWHAYAQYFAGAGFDFLALNYPEAWPRGHDSHVEQARATAALVRSLRREGYRSVCLIGVSTGTQIIQEYLHQRLDPVDAVVEYSPVDNNHWDTPKKVPPMLEFTGINDHLLHHRRRLAAIEQYRKLGDSIGWIVYENEGHDLRGRKAIEDRMKRTRQFLLQVGRSGALHADVMEVPGLDEDARTIRRVDGPVVPAK